MLVLIMNDMKIKIYIIFLSIIDKRYNSNIIILDVISIQERTYDKFMIRKDFLSSFQCRKSFNNIIN